MNFQKLKIQYGHSSIQMVFCGNRSGYEKEKMISAKKHMYTTGMVKGALISDIKQAYFQKKPSV